MKRSAGEGDDTHYNANIFDTMDATVPSQYHRAKVMSSVADFDEQKELFEIPEGCSLIRPPSSQNRSILFDYGLRVHRENDPNSHVWYCMASEECIRNRTRFQVSRSTSTPADHLNRVHNIQTRKRIKKENNKDPDEADVHDHLLFTQEPTLLPSSIDLDYDVPSTSAPTATTKRTDAICWDDYFMSVVYLSAMRSKDPNTQVGACIVDSRKRIVGIGYNGFPRGCSDDFLPWAREGPTELDTKYPFVCHAEVNAILNKNSADVEKCSIYVGLFPCNECAKMIIQSGITEVVYLSDKYKDTNSMKASRKMFTMAGVKLRQYTPQSSTIVINFGCTEVHTV